MYKEFYNLKAMPFQLAPDPSFFYESPGHKRVFSYMQYGVHQGDGFIVVTGDVGAGKTTLVNRLLNELKKEKSIIAAQLVSTQLESDELLRMVAMAFDLECENNDKVSLLKMLEKYFKEQARNNKRVLLIVDEAQNLPFSALEELRMLSNFQDGNRAIFQSFLVGQEEFKELLQVDYLEQLRQRIIASYHLGPLDINDTKHYITHRLTMAGWNNDPKITDSVFKEIYRYTLGVPRKINTLFDRMMLVASLEEAHVIDSKIFDSVINELNEEAIPRSRALNSDLHSIGDSPSAHNLEARVKRLEDLINKLESVFLEESARTAISSKSNKHDKS